MLWRSKSRQPLKFLSLTLLIHEESDVVHHTGRVNDPLSGKAFKVIKCSTFFLRVTESIFTLIRLMLSLFDAVNSHPQIYICIISHIGKHQYKKLVIALVLVPNQME